MPRVSREALGFLVLLVSVPVQYLLVEHMSGTSTNLRPVVVISLVNRLTSWEGIKNLFNFNVFSSPHYHEGQTNEVECPALEVLRYREKSFYFGMSTVARSYRPSHLSFRVGQVVRSISSNYKGVIVGWDSVTAAPPQWIAASFPSDKSHWKAQPSYRILVDSSSEITYEPQENIEVLRRTKIRRQDLADYFIEFDGTQYLPKTWLKIVYPKD